MLLTFYKAIKLYKDGLVKINELQQYYKKPNMLYTMWQNVCIHKSLSFPLPFKAFPISNMLMYFMLFKQTHVLVCGEFLIIGIQILEF